jgi:hypothetical protein
MDQVETDEIPEMESALWEGVSLWLPEWEEL